MLVVSLDPGESSAAVVLKVPDSSPAELVVAYQVKDGVQGFLTLLDKLEEYRGFATWICEKFSPRPSTATGFQQSLSTSLPLVCEGVLIGRGLMPVYTSSEKRYRAPTLQYLVGGKDKADKKKRLHRFLKESGFYVAPSAVDSPDADDVRSALGHALAYLQREVKHRGIHDMVTKWIEETDG